MGLSTDYKLGVKREVLRAVELTLQSNQYPDEQLRGKIKPTYEYPLHETQYPAVYLTFSESELRSAGVGHYEYIDTGTTHIARHWTFTGQINFNILALTAEDRDMVASGIINMIAFNANISEFRPFRTNLFDGEFVSIQPLMDFLTPLGDHVETAPFGGEDDLMYGTGYGLQVFGDFYSDASNSDQFGELVTIAHIDAYGYNTNPSDPQPIPQGVDDPAEWS